MQAIERMSDEFVQYGWSSSMSEPMHADPSMMWPQQIEQLPTSYWDLRLQFPVTESWPSRGVRGWDTHWMSSMALGLWLAIRYCLQVYRSDQAMNAA